MSDTNTTENTQTLGQRRVKAEFNPSKTDLVDQIKNKSAELIDLIEQVDNGQERSGEQRRVMALAQTNVETGCMYAVKALFTR